MRLGLGLVLGISRREMSYDSGRFPAVKLRLGARTESGAHID